eukprot:30861-Pelagococcus_subviridis.AAC.6
MRLEERRQAHRVVVVPRDAQRQRLHPAKDQVRRVRVQDAAHDVVELSALRDELFVADDAPGEDVVVPAEVLGRAVNHEVGAARQRLAVHRRRERAVDAHDAVLRLAQLRDALHVHAPQVWVRGRLGEVQRAVVLVQRLLQAVVIARV